jgi:hypothetical protein
MILVISTTGLYPRSFFLRSSFRKRGDEQEERKWLSVMKGERKRKRKRKRDE